MGDRAGLVRACALALVLPVAGGCSPSLGLEAARVLADLGAAGGPSALKESTPAPRREAVAYRIGARGYRGDYYRPGERALASLVLVPGAARAGKDDPRLVAFAKSLARARFAVLVPDMAGVRALRVSASDAGEIADAVTHLDSLGVGGGDGVGLVAISYAAGPALLAALDPAIAGRVRFVLAIGGYYDVTAVVTFFTTGYYRDRGGGPWRWRRPNEYGKWVFVGGNVARLRDATDRAVLDEMVRRKLDDLSADIGDLPPRLGPEGRAVYALLENREPDRVAALLAALPESIRGDIAALDLKTRDLSSLSARLILIHGRDDAIIPYGESVALAGAVPAGRVELYLVDSLAHADLGPGGIRDAITLWRAVYRLLELRGEGS